MFLIECGNSLCFLQMFKRSVLISLCSQTLDEWFYTIYMDFTHSVWSYTKRCKKSRVLGVKYFNHTGCLCKWNDKYEVCLWQAWLQLVLYFSDVQELDILVGWLGQSKVCLEELLVTFFTRMEKRKNRDIVAIKSSETPFDFVVCSPSSMELWLKLAQPSAACSRDIWTFRLIWNYHAWLKLKKMQTIKPMQTFFCKTTFKVSSTPLSGEQTDR